jgi:hypothetical protein
MIIKSAPVHVTLPAIGISRERSSRWQQFAAMPDDHFETAVATAKDTTGQVTSGFRG